MHAWKLRLVSMTIAWMLILGNCLAQPQDGTAAPTPADPAVSAPTRGAAPTPYRTPIAVPSAAGSIAPLQLPMPSIVVTPPTPPSLAGSCDSAGCWGTDGTRYNALGGSLVRPDGRMCQNVGGAMQCQ